MSTHKPFGDMCQNETHNFMTLPISYPVAIREIDEFEDPRAVRDMRSINSHAIRARYKCELCGKAWQCSWAATDAEIQQWENEHLGDVA